MAVVEGRWPNVRDQYELEEVIGLVLMLWFVQ